MAHCICNFLAELGQSTWRCPVKEWLKPEINSETICGIAGLFLFCLLSCLLAIADVAVVKNVAEALESKSWEIGVFFQISFIAAAIAVVSNAILRKMGKVFWWSIIGVSIPSLVFSWLLAFDELGGSVYTLCFAISISFAIISAVPVGSCIGGLLADQLINQGWLKLSRRAVKEKERQDALIAEANRLERDKLSQVERPGVAQRGKPAQRSEGTSLWSPTEKASGLKGLDEISPK